MTRYLLLFLTALVIGCSGNTNKASENLATVNVPFVWENASIYFLLTDRFNNGDRTNDFNYNQDAETGVLRGYQGGDIKGIIEKIEDNYFSDLGVQAIWFTPVVEQIHGDVDEGTGVTYGYHGYWAKDWTSLDKNFGTMEDLKNLVELAHEKNIRIILDGVINHTGPVTDLDPVWPDNWVRTSPQCTYENYENTTNCTLVANLPDVLTGSEENVALPPQLVEKWQNEGRYELEMAELDAFFERTGYPRAPKYYIIKWLTDYIREFGIDGYRADTVKHTEEDVWGIFKTECDIAFQEWKTNHPEAVLDNNDFYMVGEVYNYNISGKLYFDFGDKKVNYFNYGFTSMINFEFKYNANDSYEAIFSKYSDILNNELAEFGVVNYVSSHDDSGPFDKERTRVFESANKLLLAPGGAQIYYGDESARPLIVKGAVGDANLRSFMNWESIENDEQTKEVLTHWQKLNNFRKRHPSIGAGNHAMVSEEPYVFQRNFEQGDFKDAVIVGLDLNAGLKIINVQNVFKDGDLVYDAYANEITEVIDGKVTIESPFNIILLEKHANYETM